MNIRLSFLAAAGFAFCSTAAESPPAVADAAPAAAAESAESPAVPGLPADGKIVVEVDVNGKKETRVIDLNDPASIAAIQGKAVITTEINGRRETRLVDLKDADKFLPPAFFNEKPPVRTGPVTFLGVAAIEVPHEVSAQLPLPPETGLLVGAVAPDSPAAAAGLMESDVLSRLDDQILITQRQLAVLIANHREGDSVRLTYFRKGKQMEVTAVLGKREAPAPMENPAPFATVTRHVIKFGENAGSIAPGALDRIPEELRPSVEKLIRESVEQSAEKAKLPEPPAPPAGRQ